MQSWRYVNPVDIQFGSGTLSRLGEKLAGRDYCLCTYSDLPYFRELADRVAAEAGKPAVIVDKVEPNPSYASLREACAQFAASPVQPAVIVALGGGSVIDTSKVLAASGGSFERVQDYLEGRAKAETLAYVPIIAIPTTAGTGSEVTSWATVWDTANRRKFSLARPNLYPEAALVDPQLTLTVPRSLTLQTALDSLSHALESIWNTSANPVSANHAVSAASEIIAVLPQLVERLDDIDLRTRACRASLLAGLAFSNTKTAIAHSLSYYLTLNHGIPHGIACSFSLPGILRGIIGLNPDCDATLKRIFGDDLAKGADRFEAWLNDLGVKTKVVAYGPSQQEWLAAIDDAMLGERGRNFIGTRDAIVAHVN